MKNLLAASLLLFTMNLHAGDASSILARVDRFRSPYESFVVDVELTSHTGQRSETSKFKVFGKGSDRSVVEFTYPQTDRGRYLLMVRDAMWIYLPSASRPIRISPLQRLMGQASNGDVARTSFAVDYNASTATRETLDGRSTYVLDLVAKDPSVAYNRLKLWVDEESAEPLRADFYVVSGKLIKRALYRKYDVIDGRRQLTEIEILDLLRPGHRTVMRYSNQARRDNPDKMFSKDSLGKF